MKHFTINTAPPMSNGLMLAALSGPHDMAQSATTALKHLMQQDRVVTFTQADPDGLFIYNNLSPDYQVAADLARSVQQFTRSAGKRLLNLEQQESDFRKAVDAAVARNPMLASIVLAAEQAESQRKNQRNNQDKTELGDISPEEMTLEVEQFLRAERENDRENGQDSRH